AFVAELQEGGYRGKEIRRQVLEHADRRRTALPGGALGGCPELGKFHRFESHRRTVKKKARNQGQRAEKAKIQVTESAISRTAGYREDATTRSGYSSCCEPCC